MKAPALFRTVGLLMMLFGATLLVPALVSLLMNDGMLSHFLQAMSLTSVIGVVLWATSRNAAELRTRDGFIITTLFYLILGSFGALPLWLSQATPSFTDAVFETVSGLTTTGATTIVGLDALPPSINFYRCFLQWLGGMGLVVLAVAILPMMGIGGMQLYRAESPGPVKDKLTPRIADTAKSLWLLYVGLTAACALSYWLAGMSAFDAISHSFSTLATGGYSTHDASIAFFNSLAIEAIAIVFMLIGGINFGLHYLALTRRNPITYWRDPELKTLLGTLLLITGISSAALIVHEHDHGSHILEAVWVTTFQAVSLVTTTGYLTSDLATWPTYAGLLVFLGGVMGASAGSTSGGVKCIRVLLLYLQAIREIRRLIHPNGVFAIKLAGRRIPDRVIDAVWAFFSVYVLAYLTLWLIVCARGLDALSAFSAVGTTLSNIGPGMGSVAANFRDVDPIAKWVLSFAMVLGRLEIFTLLVLFTPAFWRK